MRFTAIIGSMRFFVLAISVLTVIFLAMFFLAPFPFPFQFLNPQFLLMQFAPDSILAEKIPFSAAAGRLRYNPRRCGLR